MSRPTHHKILFKNLVFWIIVLPFCHKIKNPVQSILDIVLRMSLNRGHNFRVRIRQFNVKHLGYTHTAFSKKHITPIILPNIFTKRCDFLRVFRANRHQPHHLIIVQVRKRNVFILDHRRMTQISIDQILNLTIIKEINPNNMTVLIIYPNYDVRIVVRITIG